ncbi:hypothetical protein RHGRI_023523 [Rhododendron griersonianum]|uniref:Endonuclease/exonuclease/phosphatase domain-containing protein n=1 Tax=Rhododendron griersonianum TaxID=479676 RepID=A0AAV6J441_9ERIC|nr:hypothetical protein RHGRI_023523 [Rhododendron griersonianum]
MFVAWNPQVLQVDLVFSSPQLIVVKVLPEDRKLFYVSYVYGQNNMMQRRRLWGSNKRGGGGDIKSKLDRVLINASWLDVFPESETTFLAPGISDHSFILVSVLPGISRKTPFKFFSFWMKHAEFKEELQKS